MTLGKKRKVFFMMKNKVVRKDNLSATRTSERLRFLGRIENKLPGATF